MKNKDEQKIFYETILKLKNENLTNEKINSVLNLVEQNFKLTNTYQDLNTEAFNSFKENAQSTFQTFEKIFEKIEKMDIEIKEDSIDLLDKITELTGYITNNANLITDLIESKN